MPIKTSLTDYIVHPRTGNHFADGFYHYNATYWDIYPYSDTMLVGPNQYSYESVRYDYFAELGYFRGTNGGYPILASAPLETRPNVVLGNIITVRASPGVVQLAYGKVWYGIGPTSGFEQISQEYWNDYPFAFGGVKFHDMFDHATSAQSGTGNGRFSAANRRENWRFLDLADPLWPDNRFWTISVWPLHHYAAHSYGSITDPTYAWTSANGTNSYSAVLQHSINEYGWPEYYDGTVPVGFSYTTWMELSTACYSMERGTNRIAVLLAGWTASNNLASTTTWTFGPTGETFIGIAPGSYPSNTWDIFCGALNFLTKGGDPDYTFPGIYNIVSSRTRWRYGRYDALAGGLGSYGEFRGNSAFSNDGGTNWPDRYFRSGFPMYQFNDDRIHITSGKGGSNGGGRVICGDSRLENFNFAMSRYQYMKDGRIYDADQVECEGMVRLSSGYTFGQLDILDNHMTYLGSARFLGAGSDDGFCRGGGIFAGCNRLVVPMNGNWDAITVGSTTFRPFAAALFTRDGDFIRILSWRDDGNTVYHLSQARLNGSKSSGTGAHRNNYEPCIDIKNNLIFLLDPNWNAGGQLSSPMGRLYIYNLDGELMMALSPLDVKVSSATGLDGVEDSMGRFDLFVTDGVNLFIYRSGFISGTETQYEVIHIRLRESVSHYYEEMARNYVY